MNVRHRLFVFHALLFGALLSTVLSLGGIRVAHAATAPQITSFEASIVDELAPGTELAFRVTGTPGGRASVRVTGIQQPIRLRERQPGVYEGSYTLKRADRPTAGSAVRATLRRQDVATTARLSTPLISSTSVASASGATIQSFSMGPTPIEPGAELAFSLHGTPGGRAAVAIGATGRLVPLAEVQPGVYEGTYTVRRQDRFTPAQLNATLQANGRIARSRLTATATASVSAHVYDVSPRQGERVASQPVNISGNLARNVDPRSVRILLSSVDVTQDATVTTSGFTYRPQWLSPGQYRVEIVSSDYAGATTRTGWIFSVLPSAAAAVPVTTIEFVSPVNNARIGTGPVEIRGRSAPNSNLNAQVTQIGSFFGFVDVKQNLLSRTVQTDPRGNFAFTFNPQDDLPAGTRYEVTVDGVIAGQNRQNKLMLVQQ